MKIHLSPKTLKYKTSLFSPFPTNWQLTQHVALLASWLVALYNITKLYYYSLKGMVGESGCEEGKRSMSRRGGGDVKRRAEVREVCAGGRRGGRSRGAHEREGKGRGWNRGGRTCSSARVAAARTVSRSCLSRRLDSLSKLSCSICAMMLACCWEVSALTSLCRRSFANLAWSSATWDSRPLVRRCRRATSAFAASSPVSAIDF